MKLIDTTPTLIIFDWKRTLYDPDKKILIRSARRLLGFLKSKNVSMVLIGKGEGEMISEVKRLELENYFKNIFFSKSKDEQLFERYVPKNQPENVIVIGDRVKSELEFGKKRGATTIWIKKGKFANELPLNKYQSPDYTVNSLEGCFALFNF